MVVDLPRDLNEEAWHKSYFSSKRCMPSGSKIIVTSQSDKITKFGTMQALSMNHLSYEAYWYFFKTLTFGSTYPKMNPKLAYLAMEIARTVKGSLYCASIYACLMREKFDIHFWYKLLAFLRRFFQKHVSRAGEHRYLVVERNKPCYFEIMDRNSGEWVICYQYHQRFSDEVPKIRLQDVIYGNVRPYGKFEALVWRSSIPSYHSLVFTCEIGKLKITGAKRKRSIKDGGTVC